jgi:hypothetical protein
MRNDAATRGGAAQAASASIGWRSIAVLTGAVLVAVAAFSVGVLLPYFANGLHHLPLSELTSGAYDPTDLWPQNGWALPLALAGVFGVLLAPLVSLSAVGVAACWLALLWCRPEPQRVVKSLALLSVLVTSGAAALFWLSGTGEALSAWWMD